MADVYATNYSNGYQTNPVVHTSAALVGGQIRVISDSYEASSDAAGTDILVGKLGPAAAIHEVKIYTDDLGTGVTLGLSTRDADANEVVIVTAQDAATAATVLFPTAADIANIGSVVGENVDLIVKIAGGTATGTIKVVVFFSEH